MIHFIIKCNNPEETHATRDTFCEALVGSPAFKDSEIAVCDFDDNRFDLYVGDKNKNDITYEVKAEYLKKI